MVERYEFFYNQNCLKCYFIKDYLANRREIGFQIPFETILLQNVHTCYLSIKVTLVTLSDSYEFSELFAIDYKDKLCITSRNEKNTKFIQ